MPVTQNALLFIILFCFVFKQTIFQSRFRCTAKLSTKHSFRILLDPTYTNLFYYFNSILRKQMSLLTLIMHRILLLQAKHILKIELMFPKFQLLKFHITDSVISISHAYFISFVFVFQLIHLFLLKCIHFKMKLCLFHN